jgi:uncharacterized protein with FMN-binding domain
MPKRPIIATFLTGVALVLLLSFKTPTVSGASNAQPQGTQGAPVSGSTQGAPVSGSRSTYSGQITGSAIDMPFGVVQVKVTFQNGAITDVTTLQAPNDNRHSLDITNYSTPRLRSEALAAQSAQINTVSGATYTSEAYAQSLQSALDQLK